MRHCLQVTLKSLVWSNTRFFSLLILASAIACSSGSSPSRTKVRFVNAQPSLGSIEFEAAGIRYTVAPREASPVFELAPGQVPVTARAASGASTTQSVFISEKFERYIVAGLFAGTVHITTIDGRFSVEGSSGAIVAYTNSVADQPRQDVYVVPAGQPIANVQPTLASVGFLGGGSRTFASGSYEIIVTPTGKKTILFQSTPVPLTSGDQLMLLGASRSAFVVTPQPIVLSLEAMRNLEDPRPKVHLLRSVEMPPNEQLQEHFPMVINVDDDLIVSLPGMRAASAVYYHVTPGTRAFSGTSTLLTQPSQLLIESGREYTQRWGQQGLSDRPGPLVLWHAPIPASDYPAPAGMARIHLIVENCCRDNLVEIDGVRLAYAPQPPGNAGLALTHDPASIRVEVFTPDTVLSEGAVAVALAPDHYYVIRFGSPLGIPGQQLYASGQPVTRGIEINED